MLTKCNNIRITQNTRLERREGTALRVGLPKGVRLHYILSECRLRREGGFHLRRHESTRARGASLDQDPRLD